MSYLSIPTELQTGFKNLIAIDDELFNKLLSFISGIEKINSIEEFKIKISDFLSSIGNDDENISDIIISLASLKVRYAEKTISQDLYNSFKDITDEDSLESIFHDRVNTIIANNKALILFFKRNLLKSNNDKTYLNSEIITDVRFVFDTELHSKDRSAIVIHNLKLKVDSSLGESDLYVTLDLESLKELKKCIERAIVKEEIIKEDYSNITFI